MPDTISADAVWFVYHCMRCGLTMHDVTTAEMRRHECDDA